MLERQTDRDSTALKTVFFVVVVFFLLLPLINLIEK